MTKTSWDVEQAFIRTAKAKTGRTIKEWMGITQASGIEDRAILLEVLKTRYGLNHLQAQLLAGIYLNGGKPVYKNSRLLGPNT